MVNSLSAVQFDQLHHHNNPFSQIDEKKKAKARKAKEMPPGGLTIAASTEKEKAKVEALSVTGMMHEMFNRSHGSHTLHLEDEVVTIKDESILPIVRRHLVLLRVLGMLLVQLHKCLRQLRLALAPTAGVIVTGEVGIDFYFVIVIF